MNLPGLLSTISQETWLVRVAYLSPVGMYLVAVPLVLYVWMQRRWLVMSSLERLGVYGLVFLFFPGLILFAPFLNFRMRGQGELP